MPLDAASHFAGKRQEERRAVDLRADLVGGGITLAGRAVDLSTAGARVQLSDRALQGFKQASDAVAVYQILERHFTSGLVVRFPLHGDIRISGRVVRIVVPPHQGAEVSVGVRFVRPVAPDEWARLADDRRLAPIPTLAPLRKGPVLQALVGAHGGGPICLLKVLRGASTFFEGSVDTARPVAVDELRARLGVTALSIRMTRGPDLLWSGDATPRGVRSSDLDGLCVTMETAAPLPIEFLHRLGRVK